MKTNCFPCTPLHPLAQSVVAFLSSSLHVKKEREKKVKMKGKNQGYNFLSYSMFHALGKVASLISWSQYALGRIAKKPSMTLPMVG
jgi:hypothetical protein